MSDQTWDYPTMESCAQKLDKLRDESNANKIKMDKAFELLTTGMQAEVGTAFIAAYAERVPSILLFSQIIDHESKTLRKNIMVMQEEDGRIAEQVREIFGK